MNGLLYKEEHLSCHNYDNGTLPVIEVFDVSVGRSWQELASVGIIVFVLEGNIELNIGASHKRPVSAGHMLFLPAGVIGKLTSIRSSSKLLVVRLYEPVYFCYGWTQEDIPETFPEYEAQHGELMMFPEIKPVMANVLTLLVQCYKAGLRCRHYHAIKVRELFFIYRAFYPKEEMMRFFSTALNSDAKFHQMVMDRCSSCISVQEMADKLNYSLAGFDRRFQKVMGITPYKWLAGQRAQRACVLLKEGSLSCAEISKMLGFGNQSALTRFLRKQTGQMPSQICQNHSKRQN